MPDDLPNPGSATTSSAETSDPKAPVTDPGNEETSWPERSFRDLALRAPVGIFETDASGDCLFVNERWCHLTGLSPAEARGRGWVRALHPDDRDRVNAEWYEAARARREFVSQYRFLRPDGVATWVSGAAAGLRDQADDIIGYVGTVTDITEAKRVEEALRASEARFRLAASAEALTLYEQDLELRYTWVHPQHPEFPEHNIGKTDAELVAGEGGELLMALKRRVLETGLGLRQEAEVSLPGGVRWYDLLVEPRRAHDGVLVGVAGAAVDITERKRAEATRAFLAEATNVLSSSLDYEATLARVAQLAVPRLADWCTVHLSDEDVGIRRLAVAHVDPEKVTWADELERRYPNDPAAPRGAAATIRTGRPELYPEISDTLLRTAARDDEHLEILRRVGLTSMMIVPLSVRGRTLGALTLAAAESKRRYTMVDLEVAEDLARRAALAIENATLYREALDSSRLKDEFLTTLSHELRTPLNAVLGWARLLGSGALDESMRRRAVETITRNASAQGAMIEDILDVSRIVTGTLRLDVESVDLRGSVEDAVRSVLPAADAKSVRIEVSCDPQVGTVSGDARRLQQVVWNLLSNAVKFTPEGGRVRVTLTETDEHVELTVSDTGIGIPAWFLPHVFERFRQHDGSTTRRHGGLGLGLAIVRHLVEAHGGRVRAESEGEGQGASFVLTLPVLGARAVAADRSRERIIEADEWAAAALDSPELAGARVLVVEDDTDAREALATTLALMNAEVRACESVRDGLAILASWRPDVVVADIAMPEEDGYSLVRQVRSSADESIRALPVVALTGFARPTDRERALAEGFDAHVAKPVDPAALRAILAPFVRNRSGGDSSA